MSQGLARTVGLDFKGSQREIRLGIGGSTPAVRFMDATLRLHPDGGDDDVFIEWHAEVGLIEQWRPTFQAVLGQIGFLNKFTVTLSRHAQEITVEDVATYDRRFPVKFLR